MPSRRLVPIKSEPELFLGTLEVRAVIRQPTVGLFSIRLREINHADRKYWERERRMACDNGSGPDSNPQCSGGVASISLRLTTVTQERLKIETAEFRAQAEQL